MTNYDRARELIDAAHAADPTRTADGRTLTTQPYDPYFEAVATPETPAQTVKLASFAEQWTEHRRWRATYVPVTVTKLFENGDASGSRYVIDPR